MRTTQKFLTDWLFCFDAKTEDTADFVPVTLPHTWNNLDGQDGRHTLRRLYAVLCGIYLTKPIGAKTP